MKKYAIVKVFMVAVLLVGFILGGPFTQTAEAHATKGHKHFSTEYETIYYDPNDSKRERGVWIALVALHPGLAAFPLLSQVIGILGLGVAYSDMEDSKATEPPPEFIIEKKVYKAKKTTSNYWGYYEINVFNTDTRKKHLGKHKVIGKTSY